MQIIKPKYEFITQIDGDAVLKLIETCGRTCYKSEDKITSDSAKEFVKLIISRKHDAVLEHYSFTVRFIIDRGISHEIVRHRIASYCQESTRYCNYSKDKFDNNITFIEPCFWGRNTDKHNRWLDLCEQSEFAYMDLVNAGATPQEARSVLPNSLKTELIMTANLKSWRNFFKLRTSKMTHPQMREIAIPLLAECKQLIPIVFDDIIVDE